MIDAAVAAGVKRFIPSEYGLNTRVLKGEVLGDWLHAKTAAVDYLITKAEANPGFTWTGLATCLFFDWVCLPLVRPKRKRCRWVVQVNENVADAGDHRASTVASTASRSRTRASPSLTLETKRSPPRRCPSWPKASSAFCNTRQRRPTSTSTLSSLTSLKTNSTSCSRRRRGPSSRSRTRPPTKPRRRARRSWQPLGLPDDFPLRSSFKSTGLAIAPAMLSKKRTRQTRYLAFHRLICARSSGNISRSIAHDVVILGAQRAFLPCRPCSYAVRGPPFKNLDGQNKSNHLCSHSHRLLNLAYPDQLIRCGLWLEFLLAWA